MNTINKIVVVITFLVILLIILSVWYYAAHNFRMKIVNFENCRKAGYPILESYPQRCRMPDGTIFTQQIIVSPSDFSLKTSLKQGVKNPLVVSGQASGSWYFEAVFIGEIYDANGRLIGQGQMMAQKDWTTSELVPFVGTISFSNPQTNYGLLVFKNANPSGSPENQKQISFPLNFRGS